MRTPEVMFDLILNVAKNDERIRAVTLAGSRVDKNSPVDVYQDFDITFIVNDFSPFYDNEKWIEQTFGKPSLLQKPESMQLIPPDNDGKFVYLMIFPDGNRIDLCITCKKNYDESEPFVILLDKDNLFTKNQPAEDFWNVKRPTSKLFDDCCNEFHWCLNNVAKGIARDEVSYVMQMMNYVRDMLIVMLEWYVGMENDFSVSAGKFGKYLRKYLPESIYQRFIKTYFTAETTSMWNGAFETLYLFGEVARKVADKLNFTYNETEEKAIENYMNQVKNAELEY